TNQPVFADRKSHGLFHACCRMQDGTRPSCFALCDYFHTASGFNLATGVPFATCSSRIAATSASVTLEYQVLSGYTTTVGPCSQGPRQPVALTNTWPGGTDRCISPILKAISSCAAPADPQDGLGWPGGRELVQTRI